MFLHIGPGISQISVIATDLDQGLIRKTEKEGGGCAEEKGEVNLRKLTLRHFQDER